MKKVVLAILTLFSLLQAEITQKQLDDYMEVSFGGNELKTAQEEILHSSLQLYKINLEDVPENIASNITDPIMKEFNEPKRILIYTKELKEMEIKTYRKIMEFYNTDIGKKYGESVNRIGVAKGRTSRLHAFIDKLKKNPFSRKKRNLF